MPYNQQHPLSPEQSHVFSPVNIPLITATAHPIPFFTSIAPNGQFFMHAPHSMQ
jgi:hypothetical protein